MNKQIVIITHMPPIMKWMEISWDRLQISHKISIMVRYHIISNLFLTLICIWIWITRGRNARRKNEAALNQRGLCNGHYH